MWKRTARDGKHGKLPPVPDPLPLAKAAARLRGRPGRPKKPPAAESVAGLVPRLVDLQGASDYLGICPRSVRALVGAGDLRPVKLEIAGRPIRRLLLAREDLDQLVDRAKDLSRP